jgi:hypothetical protein
LAEGSGGRQEDGEDDAVDLRLLALLAGGTFVDGNPRAVD